SRHYSWQRGDRFRLRNGTFATRAPRPGGDIPVVIPADTAAKQTRRRGSVLQPSPAQHQPLPWPLRGSLPMHVDQYQILLGTFMPLLVALVVRQAWTADMK